VAQGGVDVRNMENTMMDLSVPGKVEDFLINIITISFLRKTLLYGVFCSYRCLTALNPKLLARPNSV
jgi:hypothetical protein